jgi:hypothetical protein
MQRKKVLVGMLACLALPTACGDDHGPPTGNAALSIGAACYAPYNCATNYCCASPPCGGGMCTYPCRRDPECPYGTRCADGACFWACVTDRDCPLGESCKHAHTVCQY